MQTLKKPVKQAKKPQQITKNTVNPANNAKLSEKNKEKAFNNSVPPTKPVSQQSLEKNPKFSEKFRNFEDKAEETAHFPPEKLHKTLTLEEKANFFPAEPHISALKKPQIYENHESSLEKALEKREKLPFFEQIREKPSNPETFEEQKAGIYREKLENGPFFHETMPKSQIMQVLTEKILVLTEELEKLSRIVGQTMEDNRIWKTKYAKLKELYLRNVEEDVNADFFLEESGYKFEETREKSDFPDKARKLDDEFEETKEILRKTQQEVEEFQRKAEVLARKQREDGNSLREMETNFENRIKVLQNELEILRTERNNRTKAFSEEKYEKLLKNFLALKEEKDQSEKKLQGKLQEFDPSSSVLLSIPNEETGIAIGREKLLLFEEKGGVAASNKEKIVKDLKKTNKDKTFAMKKPKK